LHIRECVDEFAVNDDDIEVEEEGYLHGKKIVESDEDEGEDEREDPGTPTGNAKESVCPFSELGKGMEDVNIEEHDFAQIG
jgi:hypothetical protein